MAESYTLTDVARMGGDTYSLADVAAMGQPGVATRVLDYLKRDVAAAPGKAGDLLAGGVKGASQIGATLLAPIDAAARVLGVQNDFIGRDDRRQQVTDALKSLGADSDSIQFKAGQLGAEIAGTAGAGGALANGARVALPMLRVSPGAANAISTGLETGGFSVPGLSGIPAMAARIGTGGITTGAMAGAVDPRQAGTGAIIGGLLPPVVRGAGVVGEAVSDGMQSGANRLMKSALKPTLKAHASGDAELAAQTLLDRGINPTKGGVAQLRGLVDDLDIQIAAAIKGSGAQIDKQSVLNALAGTKTQFANQVSPAADLSAIQAVEAGFLQHPKFPLPQTTIPVEAAQDMKRGTYQVLAKKYGQMGGAETEAQKALARGLKDEIASAVPGIAGLNAEQSALIKTLGVAERRALMDANKNPMGLAALAHSPTSWAMFMADKSALFKSLAARMVNTTSPAGGAAVGLLEMAAPSPLLRGGLLATEASP